MVGFCRSVVTSDGAVTTVRLLDPVVARLLEITKPSLRDPMVILTI